MSNLGSVSSARTAGYQSTTNTNAVRSAARQQQETGLAARVSQLGPTLGTAVAGVEAVEDIACATYTAALSGINKLGHAAETAVDGVSLALTTVGDAASSAAHVVEEAVSSAADTVGDAVHTVADRFSAGLDKLGKMVDFSA